MVKFIVPTDYATAIINDDYSGLNEDQIKEIEDFSKRVYETYGNAFFMLGTMNERMERTNDVNKKLSDCIDLFINPTKKAMT